MNPRLWALALGNFTLGTGSLIVTGILPAIALSIGTSVALAGQLVTIYGLTLALGAPLLGMVTGRLAQRRVILGGLAVVAIASLIGGFATNFTTLALSRALAGLGAALFTPNAAAFAAQMVLAVQRGRAIAVVFVGFSLASVIGAPLGVCVSGEFGWRSAFGLVAALALLAMACLAWTLPHGISTPAVAARSWFRLFRQLVLMLAVAATMLCMAGQYALFTYLAVLLAQQHGIGPIGFSALLVWFGVAGVIGNIAAGRAVDRVGAGRVASVGLGVLLAAFLIIAYAGTGLLPIMIGIGLWGGAAFAVSSAQQARLVNLNPRLASATLALNTSALYGGQAGGAVLGGIAISLTGLHNVHWVGVILLAAALFVSLWESTLSPRHHVETTRFPHHRG
ncbi:MAG: MFS transporter [Burkholderiales bacterium]